MSGISLHAQTNGRRIDILDASEIAAVGKVRVITEVLKLDNVNFALDRIKMAQLKGRRALSISQ